MPGPTLTVDELAEELGRSKGWIYEHWRDLCRQHKMPAPLHDEVPLRWSRAQVYAWIDRGLSREQRAAAAAYRAAAAAAEGSRHTHEREARVADSRARLEARLSTEESAP